MKIVNYTVSLKENRSFRRLYARGKSAVGPALVLYCQKNGQRNFKRNGPKNAMPQNRFGITAGTKLGHAVVRNKVRRRLREIYRLNEEKLLPGYDIVVVARMRAVHSRYADLDKQFLRLAKKLQLLRPTESKEP